MSEPAESMTMRATIRFHLKSDRRLLANQANIGAAGFKLFLFEELCFPGRKVEVNFSIKSACFLAQEVAQWRRSNYWPALVRRPTQERWTQTWMYL